MSVTGKPGHTMRTSADTSQPTIRQREVALRAVACELGVTHVARVGGRFYFPLGDRWFLAVSADDAGRFRLETCYGTHPVGSVWSFAYDHDRLAGLARAIRTDFAALAA